MKQEKNQDGNFIRLTDEKFPWAERKWKTVKLAKIYDKAGYKPYAERAAACATSLMFNVAGDKRTLQYANFCQLRLCPMCIARKAKRNAYKLSLVMDTVEREQGGCRFLFLTLTIRNVAGDELLGAFKQLSSAWNKLMQHRAIVRAVGGWFRAMEVTRNAKSGTYHPHIHAILAVTPEYFASRSPLYISQKAWREHWQKAMGISYDPSVRVSVTKSSGGGCDSATKSATLEAAKYSAKDSEYISERLSLDEAAEIVAIYTEALRNRRLTAFGGWLKDIAKRFDADDLDGGDLIHTDDDYIRLDLAEWVETYNWSIGAGDYILAERKINPLCVVDSDTGEVVVERRLERRTEDGKE